MLETGLQAWRRNWHVATVGLLFTAGLVAAALGLVPASYVASGQIVLLPPASQRNGTGTTPMNPYLGLAGLQGMADIVARSMMDDETARTLKRAAVTNYTVQYDTLSAGPVLIVTAEETSPAAASAALSAVMQQVPETTARLQAATAADPRFFVTTSVVSRPGEPKRSGKAQLRAVGAALVIGSVLTQLAVSLVDAWRKRRREGGRGKAAQTTVGGAPADQHGLVGSGVAAGSDGVTAAPAGAGNETGEPVTRTEEADPGEPDSPAPPELVIPAQPLSCVASQGDR